MSDQDEHMRTLEQSIEAAQYLPAGPAGGSLASECTESLASRPLDGGSAGGMPVGRVEFSPSPPASPLHASYRAQLEGANGCPPPLRAEILRNLATGEWTPVEVVHHVPVSRLREAAERIRYLENWIEQLIRLELLAEAGLRSTLYDPLAERQAVRITRQTAKGTAYSASFSSQPTPEQLEALDAIADAARNRMAESDSGLSCPPAQIRRRPASS